MSGEDLRAGLIRVSVGARAAAEAMARLADTAAAAAANLGTAAGLADVERHETGGGC